MATHILGTGSGHFNPGLGEEGTGSEHEDDVENCMDGVLGHVPEGLWWRQVVAETAHRVGPGGTATAHVLTRKEWSEWIWPLCDDFFGVMTTVVAIPFIIPKSIKISILILLDMK